MRDINNTMLLGSHIGGVDKEKFPPGGISMQKILGRINGGK